MTISMIRTTLIRTLSQSTNPSVALLNKQFSTSFNRNWFYQSLPRYAELTVNDIKGLPSLEAIEGSRLPNVGNKRRTFIARKAAITLTTTALEHLRSLQSLPTAQLVRISVKNKGCAGMSYHLSYVPKPSAFDEIIIQDGVKVIVDSKALFSIIGSEMDWVHDDMQEKFIFRNPNVVDECGCGESFSV